MKTRQLPALALLALLAVQLSGCAAVVVGGAAATGLAAHDRRSFGTVVDDNVLEFRVMDAIFAEDDFDTRDRIKINAFNGWLLLAGEANTAEKVARATDIAAGVNGVRRVINELQPITKSGLGQRNHDTWLSSKVKASILRIRDLPGFDSTRVRVVAARNEIYLMGLVTRAEAEAVTEEVRHVGGVDRVITVFEYIEDQPAPERS